MYDKSSEKINTLCILCVKILKIVLKTTGGGEIVKVPSKCLLHLSTRLTKKGKGSRPMFLFRRHFEIMAFVCNLFNTTCM